MTDGGVAPAPLILHQASVVPPLADKGPFQRAPGVFDRDGTFCDRANVQRGAGFELSPRRLTAAPRTQLAGRHLYGGQINHHFGHFLCESLSRLWALDHLDRPVDSILLLPRRAGSDRTLQGFHRAVFGQLSLPVPVRIVDEPLAVEELAVPEQGFGIGALSSGTPAFRRYIHDHLAPDVTPEGPENLYISREGLGLMSGSIIGEYALSMNLRHSDYVAFAPEQHDIRTQIARYRAAKRIVAVEGSALHLYGFVGHADQQVAVIARRSDLLAANDLADQIRTFCGNSPLVVDAIRREWDVSPGPVRSSKSVSELDMVQVGQALHAAGMTGPRRWRASWGNIDRRIARISDRSNRPLTEYARGQ